MKIKLSNFGCSLGSRLKGREVFALLKSDILIADEIVLDFENIELMTMSFGTEFFDSIDEIFDGNMLVVNADSFTSKVIEFCRKNKKSLAL